MTQEQLDRANENHKVGDIYIEFGDKYEYLGERDGNHLFKPLGDTFYIQIGDGSVPFIIFPKTFKKVEK